MSNDFPGRDFDAQLQFQRDPEPIHCSNCGFPMPVEDAHYWEDVPHCRRCYKSRLSEFKTWLDKTGVLPLLSKAISKAIREDRLNILYGDAEAKQEFDDFIDKMRLAKICMFD